MLSLANVSKSYVGASGPVRALDTVSLELGPGRFVAIQGPSGCGKSTLLLIAGGLMRPDSGEVRIADTDVNALPPDARATFRGETIGFVFQQFHLVPYLSVLDNVLAASLAVRSAEPEQVRERAKRLIDRFGLSGRMHHVPGTLSTGERQRTALARALLNEPRFLLADEPTGNLDRENTGLVLDALAEFAGTGGTVLLVTHDEQAAERAESVLTMESGHINIAVPG